MNLKNITLALSIICALQGTIHTAPSQSVKTEVVRVAADSDSMEQIDDAENLFFDDVQSTPPLPAWKIWLESVGVSLLTYYLSLKERFDYYKNQVKRMILMRIQARKI